MRSPCVVLHRSSRKVCPTKDQGFCETHPPPKVRAGVDRADRRSLSRSDEGFDRRATTWLCQRQPLVFCSFRATLSALLRWCRCAKHRKEWLNAVRGRLCFRPTVGRFHRGSVWHNSDKLAAAWHAIL